MTDLSLSYLTNLILRAGAAEESHSISGRRARADDCSGEKGRGAGVVGKEGGRDV